MKVKLILILSFFATTSNFAQIIFPAGDRAVKCCFIKDEVLNFTPKIVGLHSAIPPLKGVRGMLHPNLSKNIPFKARPFLPQRKLDAFKGGEIPCKSPNFVQKINALKFAKTALNSPASGEGMIGSKCLNFNNNIKNQYQLQISKTFKQNLVFIDCYWFLPLSLKLNFEGFTDIFRTNHSPSGGGWGEEKLPKDSTYQLFQTIPINSTYLTTDNLQNIYVATPEGKIIKFDKKGKQQFEYNNNRLGQVGKIAVKNPLNILVYYPDLAVIIILDRTLSVINELNLYDLDILAPKGIALSNNNSIWVYDEITAILKKLNPDGATLFESRNLNQLVQKQLSPSFLLEKNNEVYLSDTENGLFVFDAFGQLKQTIPIKNIDQFQVIDQQILFWKEGKTFLLNQPILEAEPLPLPANLTDIKMVVINGDLMYITLADKIEIYQLK